MTSIIPPRSHYEHAVEWLLEPAQRADLFLVMAKAKNAHSIGFRGMALTQHVKAHIVARELLSMSDMGKMPQDFGVG